MVPSRKTIRPNRKLLLSLAAIPALWLTLLTLAPMKGTAIVCGNGQVDTGGGCELCDDGITADSCASCSDGTTSSLLGEFGTYCESCNLVTSYNCNECTTGSVGAEESCATCDVGTHYQFCTACTDATTTATTCQSCTTGESASCNTCDHGGTVRMSESCVVCTLDGDSTAVTCGDCPATTCN